MCVDCASLLEQGYPKAEIVHTDSIASHDLPVLTNAPAQQQKGAEVPLNDEEEEDDLVGYPLLL